MGGTVEKFDGARRGQRKEIDLFRGWRIVARIVFYGEGEEGRNRRAKYASVGRGMICER